MNMSRRLLTILLAVLLMMLVFYFVNGRDQASQREINDAMDIVRQDCKLWCLDSSTTFQYVGKYNGPSRKRNLVITLERKKDKLPEASYYVTPGTKNFMKIIHNWRTAAIDDGSAAKAKEYSDLDYTLIKEKNRLNLTSQIMHISTNGEELAMYRGKLMTLFGTPLIETDDDENAYSYLFEANDHANNKWLFTAYQGPSGFAIGGDPNQKDSKAAAVAFVDDLSKLDPADYERILTNHDFDSKVIYGCKQKRCYSK